MMMQPCSAMISPFAFDLVNHPLLLHVMAHLGKDEAANCCFGHPTDVSCQV